MATSIVSLPPLPQSPLPPSPPFSPQKNVGLSPEWISHLDSGMETPNRSPFTSASFGSTTMGSTFDDAESSTKAQPRCLQPLITSADSPVKARSRSNGRMPCQRVKLEDYELIRVLGKGCAGRVLLVRETGTNSIFAMKAVSKRSVLTFNELEHTLTEASILRRFATQDPQNPFISKLHHTFTDRENFYFVLDFYAGGDLATQMEIHGVLGHHRTRFYACDLVMGLEDLHRHGIIVRDLKPENILLNSRGHAVIADFGLSKDFGYRGEPKALHVVTYPGQGPLPEWAGKGMASSRMMPDGSKKLMVDRAYSFVGTAEYLAPEVVKRGEYTYAIDWWALGCIVLESLIGKVPFRREDDEDVIVLWNKILYDPWDDIFYDPSLRGRTPSHYGMDLMSWSFVDALLAKNPEWRLTEPYVRDHAYFAHIDWDLVRSGGYMDPHDLRINDHAEEYNLYYFPRLCLEEEPTVDMSDHDFEYRNRDMGDSTPMNDDIAFALAQAEFRQELESFTWSRDMMAVDEADESKAIELKADNSSGDDPTAPIPEGSADDGEVEVSDEDTPIAASAAEDNPISLHLSTPPFSPGIAADIPLPSPSETESLSTPTSPFRDAPLYRAQHVEGKKSSPKPIPFALSKRPLIKGDKSHDITLPTGLPASGLSVSDIVSIPSSGLDSPSRIIRRHKHLPSVDTIPISRLSVDLGGTITNLGDDDWEQLDSAEGLESLPNGHPMSMSGSFFNRMLKRRPSTLHGSALRRQARTSDLSDRSSGSPSKGNSPTKKSPMPVLWGKSGTKKALDKIKTFPKLRKTSSPPSAYHQPGDLTPMGGSPVRPETARRHTESGWFDKKPRLKKDSNVIDRLGQGASRSVSAKHIFGSDQPHKEKERRMMGMSRSVSALLTDGTGYPGYIKAKEVGGKGIKGSLSDNEMGKDLGKNAPKLELTETPPIVWEMDK